MDRVSVYAWTPLRSLALVSALLLSTAVFAAPKIVISDIKGDKKAVLARELKDQLCAKYQCVPSTRVLTKRKLDWKKVKRAEVAAVFAGSVGKVKRGTGVTLELLTGPGPAAQRWQFALRSGHLSRGA